MTRFPKTAFCAAVLFSALSFSAAAQVHLIVGKWQWTRPENKCTEVYEFRQDGKLHVVSGEEITDNTYSISPGPDPRGFYTLTTRTVKTNKGRDCTGSPAEGNDDLPYTTYLVFHRTEPQYMVCEKTSLEKCFGPFRRTK